MKIKTKYNVGYEFWVPRVLEKFEKVTILHPDEFGNPVEYYRTVTVLEATAKRKKVTSIEINIYKNETIVKYHCENYYDSVGTSVYKEEDLEFTTEKDALNFAKYWRDTEATVYFGTTL